MKENNSKHDHDHDHSLEHWRDLWPALLSFVLLILGLLFDHSFHWALFTEKLRLAWYLLAYLLVGFPVIKEAWFTLRRGEIFTEFSLMVLATIGAFAIGEYPEGVAVMLFYTIGELFQAAAVNKAKNNITALLDLRPKTASVLRQEKYRVVHPDSVSIGETIQVKVGEKIPLDGQLLSEKAVLNTAALTGESKPRSSQRGESVLAGSINLDQVIDIQVEKLFDDSSIARILEMVQNATAKKAKPELLIRKYAKIYTPIVFYLAVALTILPYFFVDQYVFSDWLYRALVFLVISCPCALVISIPLGYFGGLGAASKNGILFKGATYLDQITKVNTLVMDKTGTMTQGVFKIKSIQPSNTFTEKEFMTYLLAMEAKSSHPIAKAIMEYDHQNLPEATDLKEYAGKGLAGIVNGKNILVGNKKLLQQFKVTVPTTTDAITDTIVLLAIDKEWAGYITIADQIKSDAQQTIQQLRKTGIQSLIMLSGDKDSITQQIAQQLHLDAAYGDLLPEDKLQKVEQLKTDPNKIIAFIGDGINDAPVLASSHIGIAMGGLGADVAIETADVILQTDQPSKVATAIQIGRSTQQIIWQNIALAFGVKIIVLILGAMGFASMWAAVFADVGVALLAILNAVRLQRMEWEER